MPICRAPSAPRVPPPACSAHERSSPRSDAARSPTPCALRWICLWICHPHWEWRESGGGAHRENSFGKEWRERGGRSGEGACVAAAGDGRHGDRPHNAHPRPSLDPPPLSPSLLPLLTSPHPLLTHPHPLQRRCCAFSQLRHRRTRLAAEPDRWWRVGDQCGADGPLHPGGSAVR